jgi:hypothetical protein
VRWPARSVPPSSRATRRPPTRDARRGAADGAGRSRSPPLECSRSRERRWAVSCRRGERGTRATASPASPAGRRRRRRPAPSRPSPWPGGGTSGPSTSGGSCTTSPTVASASSTGRRCPPSRWPRSGPGTSRIPTGWFWLPSGASATGSRSPPGDGSRRPRGLDEPAFSSFRDELRFHAPGPVSREAMRPGVGGRPVALLGGLAVAPEPFARELAISLSLGHDAVLDVVVEDDRGRPVRILGLCGGPGTGATSGAGSSRRAPTSSASRRRGRARRPSPSPGEPTRTGGLPAG